METFPHYWPFVRGIHRLPVNSPHKDQWRGALMFSLICVRINGWVNRRHDREAGDLRCHRAHYDVTVMRLTHTHGAMVVEDKMAITSTVRLQNLMQETTRLCAVEMISSSDNVFQGKQHYQKKQACSIFWTSHLMILQVYESIVHLSDCEIFILILLLAWSYVIKTTLMDNETVNSSPPGQNGRHFADDISNRIFLNENVQFVTKISLKYVLRGPIDNNPALI